MKNIPVMPLDKLLPLDRLVVLRNVTLRLEKEHIHHQKEFDELCNSIDDYCHNYELNEKTIRMTILTAKVNMLNEDLKKITELVNTIKFELMN